MNHQISNWGGKLLAGAAVLSFFAVLIGSSHDTEARVTGLCSNCHTMHNSQDGGPMRVSASVSAKTGFPGNTGPEKSLTKGNCYECHGQGIVTGEAIVKIGSDGPGQSRIPQVFSTSTTDLAGGNFAYVSGDKDSSGSVAINKSKGHNIGKYSGQDAVLTAPPGWDSATVGWVKSDPQYESMMCAGNSGCHGTRQDFTPQQGKQSRPLKNGHHTDDSVIDGSAPGKSYRFLSGVVGFEDPDWQATNSSTKHNEYLGTIEAPTLTTWQAPNYSLPAGSSISTLCVMCHAKMHEQGSGSSPWLRHPSGVVLPATGDYANYTTYDTNVPVGRPTSNWPTGADKGKVTPGTDSVICLSCHGVHGTKYPDILRWDYNDCKAGTPDTQNKCGCFKCHTSKDDG